MRYRVTLQETVMYEVVVEAASEEAAETLAKETWAQSETPDHDFNGQGRGVEMYDIEEIENED